VLVYKCLPYKSDEMVHIAFPDERYKQLKLMEYVEMELWDALHACK